MSDTERLDAAPRGDLSAIAEHIQGMVTSQRQRYEQVNSLADTVQRVQAHYTELEIENARLRQDLIAANGQNAVQRQQLEQAAVDYDTLTRHLSSEVSRLQTEYEASIKRINAQHVTTIDGIRQDAQTLIDSIKVEARAAIETERANAESARGDHAAVIAENDQLNHGIEALVRAIEENDQGIEEENRMISAMMDAMRQRIPASMPQAERPATLPFLRSVPLKDFQETAAAPGDERVA